MTKKGGRSLGLQINPLKNELHHTKNCAVTLVGFSRMVVLEGQNFDRLFL
ncbi:hypothetical protein OU5_1449 [Pseudomonas mandelii JR-1]|uniref:Uncharacterized protein n=1 Tax=Pseudomonas mandelii JR-1 TaxID=1147786 RepID=A0A024E855_9PSED|nr:hypothetical protein OU5_1449 [Pseudomonas mandelii JR-1]